jgi:hypothetical protein
MPSSSVGEKLEKAFSDFETTSGWRLSLPAKVIIQQGFISIHMDTLGMGTYADADPAKRAQAAQAALSKLPAFLDILKTEAEKQPDSEKNSMMIGGIFVLQHAKSWKALFGCPCWPIS